MQRNNLFKIGLATAAATAGAILALTSVFAHSTPNTNGRSLVGSVVSAAHTASFPLLINDPAPTTLTDEQAQDAAEVEQAAEAEQAQDAAEVEQAAEAAEQAQDAAEVEQADTNTESAPTTEHHDTIGDHESGDHQGD